MAITIRKNHFTQLDKPKVYMVYIVYDKYISWEFCIRMIMNVFHRNLEDAKTITNEILTNGEGLCGVYILEIAETKAEIVEQQAKKEKFSMQCLLEEV